MMFFMSTWLQFLPRNRCHFHPLHSHIPLAVGTNQSFIFFYFFLNTLEQRSDFFLLTCLIASCSRALREEKRNKQRGKREATKSNYVFLIKTKHETGMTYSMYSTHTCTWRSSYLLFDRGQNGGGRLRFRSVSIRGWHHRGNHGPLLLLHRLLWHRHHYY